MHPPLHSRQRRGCLSLPSGCKDASLPLAFHAPTLALFPAAWLSLAGQDAWMQIYPCVSRTHSCNHASEAAVSLRSRCMDAGVPCVSPFHSHFPLRTHTPAVWLALELDRVLARWLPFIYGLIYPHLPHPPPKLSLILDRVLARWVPPPNLRGGCRHPTFAPHEPQ